MIIEVPSEKGRDIASAALCARVVLSRAIRPLAGVLNVDLSRGMNIAKVFAWENRDGVFLVVDVGHGDGLIIDVVGKGLIANLFDI